MIHLKPEVGNWFATERTFIYLFTTSERSRRKWESSRGRNEMNDDVPLTCMSFENWAAPRDVWVGRATQQHELWAGLWISRNDQERASDQLFRANKATWREFQDNCRRRKFQWKGDRPTDFGMNELNVLLRLSLIFIFVFGAKCRNEGRTKLKKWSGPAEHTGEMKTRKMQKKLFSHTSSFFQALKMKYDAFLRLFLRRNTKNATILTFEKMFSFCLDFFQGLCVCIFAFNIRYLPLSSKKKAPWTD